MINRKEYSDAMANGYLLSKRQEQNIILSVLELLADAEPIFFKDGKWQPLKWNSIGRWIELAKLSYRFIKLIINIINKK